MFRTFLPGGSGLSEGQGDGALGTIQRKEKAKCTLSYQYLVGSCQDLLNIGKIIRSDHNFKQITSPPESQNHAEPRRTLKNLAVPLHCMKFMLCFDPNLKKVVACFP